MIERTRFEKKLDALQERLDRERAERHAEELRGEARMLLRRLESGGYRVVLREDGVTVNVAPMPTHAHVEQLKMLKPQIVEVLKAAK